MSPYGRVTLKTDLNLSPSVPLSVYFGAWLGATRAVYFRVKKGGQPKKETWLRRVFQFPVLVGHRRTRKCDAF